VVFGGGLLALLSLLAFAYCLLDLVTSRREDVRTLPKPAWFVVLLVPVLGPAAWYLAGRPAAGSGRTGPRVLPGAAPPASSPDDDEEFLRELRRRAEEQRRQAERQRKQDDEDRSA
jgi:hypothetical protein